MARKLVPTIVLLALSLAASAQIHSGTISGAVKNSAGVPQMGAAVKVLLGAGEIATVFTDAHGRYTAANLPAGTYVVRASATAFLPSLRENVALTAPGAQLDRIIASCKIAGLSDDITEMPMGYDTVISDGGGSLSGGQRQRVAIARAVIRNPSLMLLDEATSALDNATEKRVIENLERLRCTRITVAHRLSTVRNADLIVVMDKGRIIEQGNHAHLLATGGLYARLVAASQNPIPTELPHVPHAIPLGSAAPGGVQSTRSHAHRA